MWCIWQTETFVCFTGPVVISLALINDGFLKWEIIADTHNAESSIAKMSNNEYALWSMPDRVLRVQKVKEVP